MWESILQYTGNVNKIIWWLFLPFLFLVYFSYLVFDYINWNDGNLSNIVGKHKENTLNNNNIHGIVLGGSNAFFGLSAELLGEKSGEDWMNISLLNEGYSDENYWEFIGNVLSENQRLSITKVIYSSITPLVDKEAFQLRGDTNQDLLGKKPIGLLPSTSLIAHLKNSIFSEKNKLTYPIPNSYGDFDFSKFTCNLTDDNKINYNPDIDSKKTKVWIQNQLSQLEYFFPHATIYFVIPSQFYSKDFEKDKLLKLNKNIGSAIEEYNHKFNSKIIFITQQELPTQNLLCDAMHHPNEAGRRWRTKNLSYHIFKSNK